MTHAIPAALALALAACAAPVQSQAIYRCGDSYSQQPCAGGKAITGDAQMPTAAERRQSAAATQRDAKLADSLEKERLQQEAQPTQLYVPPPRFDAAPPAHKWPEKAATRKLDVFTASAPVARPPAGKKKKKGKGAAKESDPQPARDGKAAGTLAVQR